MAVWIKSAPTARGPKSITPLIDVLAPNATMETIRQMLDSLVSAAMPVGVSQPVLATTIAATKPKRNTGTVASLSS